MNSKIRPAKKAAISNRPRFQSQNKPLRQKEKKGGNGQETGPLQHRACDFTREIENNVGSKNNGSNSSLGAAQRTSAARPWQRMPTSFIK